MVNLAVQDDVLDEIDEAARLEQQSRAELILRSVKLYITRKRRLAQLYSYGEQVAQKEGFTEEDVMKEIKAYREEKREK
jgi:metal-responsive CopG/Arc/MetJ family transcriptional regulator